MRGVVQAYDSRRNAGLILPDGGGSPLPFSHHSYGGISTFDIGDKVDFDIEGDIERLKLKFEKLDFSGLFSLLCKPSQGDKAIHVQIYETADISKDVLRCPTCRRYVLRRETFEVGTDSDWGEGVDVRCKKCKGIVSPTGQFGYAYREYREGKMLAEEAREFEEALADRTKISNFLNRKYLFH